MRRSFVLEGDAVIADQAKVARGLLERVVGLLTYETLGEGEALILPRCNSIHTFGMRFAIDAIFVDRAWRVVALRQHVPPGRIILPVWGAWGVIELAQGTLARLGLQVGDPLRLREG